MSTPEDDSPGLLSRWSRRKALARTGVSAGSPEEAATAVPAVTAPAPAVVHAPSAATPAAPAPAPHDPPAPTMRDVAALGPGSDIADRRAD